MTGFIIKKVTYNYALRPPSAPLQKQWKPGKNVRSYRESIAKRTPCFGERGAVYHLPGKQQPRHEQKGLRSHGQSEPLNPAESRACSNRQYSSMPAAHRLQHPGVKSTAQRKSKQKTRKVREQNMKTPFSAWGKKQTKTQSKTQHGNTAHDHSW